MSKKGQIFGKGLRAQEQMESVVSAPKKPGDAMTPPREGSNAKSIPSLFGADATLEGNLSSDGDLQFDGKIKGNIRADKLTIGKDAHVFGEISANSITVHGRVKGSIRGRTVEILSTGHMEGEVVHNELSVQAGAFFMGNCRRVDDPFAGGAKKPMVDQTHAAEPGDDGQASQGADPIPVAAPVKAAVGN